VVLGSVLSTGGQWRALFKEHRTWCGQAEGFGNLRNGHVVQQNIDCGAMVDWTERAVLVVTTQSLAASTHRSTRGSMTISAKLCSATTSVREVSPMFDAPSIVVPTFSDHWATNRIGDKTHERQAAD
jgi:hypothetical protein